MRRGTEDTAQEGRMPALHEDGDRARYGDEGDGLHIGKRNVPQRLAI